MPCIESIISSSRLMWAGKISRMEERRIPRLIMCAELVEGKRAVGAPPKSWRHCLKDDLMKFNIDAQTWMNFAADENSWKQMVIRGAEYFNTNWFSTRDRRSNRRHAMHPKSKVIQVVFRRNAARRCNSVTLPNVIHNLYIKDKNVL